MIVDDIFIANNEGDSKTILKVKKHPNIYGVIEKDYNKDRTKTIFTIKYFWNDVFQDEKFADTMDEAKMKLKDILSKVIQQTSHIQTFEQFTINK